MYIAVLVKKSASILLLIVLSCFQNVTAQHFADKTYYLVDSLELSKLSSADKKLIDSCLTFFHQETDDTTRLKGINTIIEKSWDDKVWPKYNSWVYDFVQEKLKEKPNKKITRKLRIYLAGTINNTGYNLNNSGNISAALKFYEKGLKIQEELNDKEGMATSLNNIGAVYKKQGDIANALTYYHKSLEIYQEIDNPIGLGHALSNIGNITQEQGDQNLALEYLHKSRNIYQEIGEKRSEATLLNNIGFAYFKKKNNEKALQYYNKSILLRKTVDDQRGIANTYNNIAKVYQIELDYEMAMDYFFKSNAIFKSLNYKLGLSTNSINIGRLFYLQNNLSKGKTFALIGLDLAKKVESPTNILGASKLLSDIYADEGKGMKAFEMYKLYTTMRDSIKNEKNEKAIIQQSIRYQYQKEKAIDDAERDNLIAIEQKENEKQQVMIYAIGFGLLLVLLFLIFVFNRLQVTKKQKKVIEEQRDIVEKAHKEIRDSIIYAERIQRSFLATDELLNNNLKDYFVFFQPKDVVSGDFYWAGKLANNNFAIVNADSTGHGVPGAIMSILNISSIEKAIENGFLKPSEIFSHTRATIIDRLSKDGSAEGGKDGMDASIISFDFENNSFSYTAAQNPIWILRKRRSNSSLHPELEPGSHHKKQGVSTIEIPGQTRNNDNAYELIEIKPEKMPIGKHHNDTSPFVGGEFKTQKGDVIYSTTDGFQDQFGGEKGKKFKIKPFKTLLLSIAHLPMQEQKEILSQRFSSWKGKEEQVDDVCVIGVRV